MYPNGKKLWRMSYRFEGKQRDLAFGPYPHISLLDARKKREVARDPARRRRSIAPLSRLVVVCPSHDATNEVFGKDAVVLMHGVTSIG